uniref:Uncharacterized protein n=1 Tax=Arundo donax TaxID=35708 RepID=A0A0A9AXZ7_ARUDO
MIRCTTEVVSVSCRYDMSSHGSIAGTPGMYVIVSLRGSLHLKWRLLARRSMW